KQVPVKPGFQATLAILLQTVGGDGHQPRLVLKHRPQLPGNLIPAHPRHGEVEGVVAKHLASPYRPGRRSAAWWKIWFNRKQAKAMFQANGRRDLGLGEPAASGRVINRALLDFDADGIEIEG